MAIADDSVWNSSRYRNWRFLKNVDDSENLRDVLETFPFEAVIFLSTDPHYCTELWEPLTLENKREMKEECAQFISNTHHNLIELYRLSITTWRVLVLIKNMLHSQPMQE